MADEKINYSDLVNPDGSIQNLIDQLEELNRSFGSMVNAIKGAAKEVIGSLRPVSGATSEGRAAIDEMTAAASRLEKAQKELKFAMSDTGKEVAWIKAQTREVNKTTVEHNQQVKELATSYNRIKKDIDENIRLWKSLTREERAADDYGGEVLRTIVSLKSELAALNSQMKPTIQSMSALEREYQRLAYYESAEGQELLSVRKKIHEVINGRKQEAAEMSNVEKAQAKLTYARSEENKEIIRLKAEINDANRIAKLEMQVANSKIGSYNQLAALYELNKIKLNAMSGEMRASTDEGKKLEQETLNIYKQMIHLQEATGNHKLSVGNYAKAWNGLGNAMNQIIREIPAATMGINTFFLAISNNVPILIDELQRVKDKNEMLRAEGRPTQNIIKTIVDSILSWQTALILLLTALSMNGKAIFNWIRSALSITKPAKDVQEALEEVAEAAEKHNQKYGESVVLLKQLGEEWKNLDETADRTKWIKKHITEFKNLGIAINDVIEAEHVFNEGTQAVLDSLKYRAMGAAARSLAEDKYREAMQKEIELENEKKKGPSFSDKFVASMLTAGQSMSGTYTGRSRGVIDADMPVKYGTGATTGVINSSREMRLQKMQKEIDVIKADADAFYDLAKAKDTEAIATLRNANIKEHWEVDDSSSGKRGRKPIDLTDRINRNELTIRSAYEKSITSMYIDELGKRQSEEENVQAATERRLRLLEAKNKLYLSGLGKGYKALTEQQKAQLNEQNKLIEATINNELDQLSYQLTEIELERRLRREIALRQNLVGNGEAMESSINEERNIKAALLTNRTERARYANRNVENAGNEEAIKERELEITAEYNRKLEVINAEAEKLINENLKNSLENRIKLVQKYSDEELLLNEERIEAERKIALAKNKILDPSKQKSEDEINDVYNQAASSYKGNFQLNKLKAQIEAEKAAAETIKKARSKIEMDNLKWERQIIDKRIELHKAGAIKLSEEEFNALQSAQKKNQQEQDKRTGLNGFIRDVGKEGLGDTLLDRMGFNEEYIEAMDEVVSITLDNINSIMEADIKLAEIEVETAEKRVEAAQKVLDAEIEARNNGYANNVAQAQKDLDLEKKQQEKKTKLLEQAQRRQEAINSITQASSLVTASAQLWSTFSGMGPVGPALAIAAIAAMWASFAVAKVKARQLSKAQQSDKYGEGGLEILDGGSHLAGNDIDLGTKNSKGNNMRAEGGEALAIINRRNTRKYRKQLPAIIESLNKGTFENKYLRAFESGETLQAQIMTNTTNIDLSRLEKSVDDIKKQNETKLYALSDGTTLVIKGNVKRFIKN